MVNVVTIDGNLTDNPELRFFPDGTSVANFRIANDSGYRSRDGGKWVERMSYVRVEVRGSTGHDMPENVVESLSKGARVVVHGRLQIREYTNSAGERAWITEIVAYEVTPSLRWAQASLTKTRGRSVSAPAPVQSSQEALPLEESEDERPF